MGKEKASTLFGLVGRLCHEVCRKQISTRSSNRGCSLEGNTIRRMAIRGHKHPALRNFLRGYLHEDFAEEYGSLAEAVKDFKSHTTDWEAMAMTAHQLHSFI